MPIDYTSIVVLSVCAITFYRMGQLERSWAPLWAALSVGASVVTLFVFHFGLIAVFVAQALLFGCITAYRVLRKE